MNSILLLSCFLVLSVISSPSPFPGLTSFNTGYNAASLTNPPNAVPLFELTYNQGKTFSPPGRPDIIWAVPDQISVSAYDRSESSTHANIGASMSTVIHTMEESDSWSFNIPIGVGSIAVNYNHEAGNAYYKIKDEANIVGIGQVWQGVYSATLLPAFMLKPSAVVGEMFDALPSTVSTAHELDMYTQVFERLGTHYPQNGISGGRARLYSFLHNSTLDQHSMNWASTQIQIQLKLYFFSIGGGSINEKKNLHLDEDFVKHSQVSTYWIGGSPALQSNATMMEWWKTSIGKYPEIINSTFAPISELIQDSDKSNLYQQYSNYFLKHGCNPIEPTMTTACKKPAPKPASSTLKPTGEEFTTGALTREHKDFLTSFASNDDQFSSDWVQNNWKSYCPFPSPTSANYCPKLPATVSGTIEESTHHQVISQTTGYSPLKGRIGVGWNPTNGYLGLPVVDLTYPTSPSKSQLYVDPVTHETFVIPNQVDLTPQALSNPLYSVPIYQNELKYEQQLRSFNPKSTSGSSVAGMMSHTSQTLQSVYSQFFGNGASAMTLVQDARTVYDLKFSKPISSLSLIPYMQQWIGTLPKAYNQQTYTEFIDLVGTDIVTSASFGGVAEQQTFLKECVYGQFSTQDLENYAKWDFEHQTSNFPSPKQPNTYVNSKTLSTVDVYGGYADIDPIKDYQSRIASYAKAPFMVNLNFEPIQNFVSDPTIKANLAKARSYIYEQAAAAAASQQSQVVATEKKEWAAAHPAFMKYTVSPDPASVYGWPQCCMPDVVNYPELDVASGQSLGNKKMGNSCGGHGWSCNWHINADQFVCERNSEGLLRFRSLVAVSGAHPTGPWVKSGSSSVTVKSQGFTITYSCSFPSCTTDPVEALPPTEYIGSKDDLANLLPKSQLD